MDSASTWVDNGGSFPTVAHDKLEGEMMSVSDAQLKEMVKSAMTEALVEQRSLLREIIEEVIEDIALSRAIDEGMKSPAVSRDEVFAALDSQ